MTLVYTTPTKRRSMTKARAAKIFMARDGVCYLCSVRIYDGEDWQVEHPDELADGGSDDDALLHPVHTACHKPKTAAARAVRAKRNRLITKRCVSVKAPSRWPPKGSRPISRKQRKA